MHDEVSSNLRELMEKHCKYLVSGNLSEFDTKYLITNSSEMRRNNLLPTRIVRMVADRYLLEGYEILKSSEENYQKVLDDIYVVDHTDFCDLYN